MSGADERRLFLCRLKEALGRHGYADDSGTALAREFNKRSSEKVTAHGARRWLFAETMPTYKKIKILADWLGVDTIWLMFGDKSSNEDAILTEGATISEDPITIEDKMTSEVATNQKDIGTMADIKKLMPKYRKELDRALQALLRLQMRDSL
jgi:transcriptional regulator with XRE-family HTH domain